MAEKNKLIELTITANVSIGGKIRKKGETVKLPEDQAKLLIEGKHAVYPGEPEKPEDFLARLKTATKAELLQVKTDVEKVLAAEPGRKDAQSTLETVSELLKKAK